MYYDGLEKTGFVQATEVTARGIYAYAGSAELPWSLWVALNESDFKLLLRLKLVH